MITLPVLWGMRLWGEIRINGFVQLVTNAGWVRSQKWCSSWGQNDFFSHFHSITPTGTTISQCEGLLACFSFSVTHIKSKCCPFLNENISIILDGSITFDPLQSLFSPSVLGGWSNTIVSPAPTTYWGGRRWGEGREGRGMGVWGNENKPLSPPLPCYATSRPHLDSVP